MLPMPTATTSEARLQIGHVLFIDMVGYSKLLINEQTSLLRELNELVQATEQFRVAEKKHRLLRIATGDGMALVFRDSPESPAQCALQISQALRSRTLPFSVRMGIHCGPVSEVTDVNKKTNVAGAGINIAQRVMDCGDAGHILLSKHVAEDLEHYARWRPLLHDLGECEVKHGAKISVVNLYTENAGNSQPPEKLRRANVGAAVPGAKKSPINRKHLLIAGAIISAFVIGFAMFRSIGIPQRREAVRSEGEERRSAASVPIPEKSIAVLPFVDLSQTHDQEYFCDGISEEILDALAKVEGLRVVARTSSFSFKGKNADVGEIAQKLNVQSVLEGSLRREGNRIRISAQLVNARDGFHIWSDTFERELQGVFAVQDEITRSIVDALKIKLAVAPPARTRQNTEAYDLYLKGLYFSNKSDEQSLRKSLTLFQRALDIDPNFARAWTGIAKDWEWLADAYVRPLDAYPAMRAAAKKAIELDEKEAEAHCYLGDSMEVLDFDVAGCQAELKRALQLDPNCAIAHLFLAFEGADGGDPEAAMVHVRQAVQLDPLSPIVSEFASSVYLACNRLDDALAEAQRTESLAPNSVYENSALGRAYREKGMLAEAVTIFIRASAATGVLQPGLAITYAKMGRKDDALRVLEQITHFGRTHYVAGDEIASIYVALGDNDAAFYWLDRAYQERSGSLRGITSQPDFRSLYSDPRFANLVKRIGFHPAKVSDAAKRFNPNNHRAALAS